MISISHFSIYRIPAGWRDWNYLQLESKNGATGLSEVTESNGFTTGLIHCIHDALSHVINVQFESPLELRDFLRKRLRQSLGGVGTKAISAIENAAWDLWSLENSIPISTLLNRPSHNRSDLMVYWSHCGTTRVRSGNLVGKPSITNQEELETFSQEIQNSGVRAFKTNLIDLRFSPAQVLMPGFGKHTKDTALVNREFVPVLERSMKALRKYVGDEIESIVDFNFNLNLEDYYYFEEMLSRYSTRWIEIDFDSSATLKSFKSKGYTKVCSGENLLGVESYLPIIDSDFVNVISIDLLWNGLLDSIAIAELALKSGKSFTLHNYYSHLSTFMCLRFLDMFNTFELLEFDYDDVSMRDEIFKFSTPYLPIQGRLPVLNSQIGWGLPELNRPTVSNLQVRK